MDFVATFRINLHFEISSYFSFLGVYNRDFRARLKEDYYDTEETNEDRLKKENGPPGVDEKDWKWLVEYFGTSKFQVIVLIYIAYSSFLN